MQDICTPREFISFFLVLRRASHLILFFFFLMLRRPLRSTLFPYTTLFRSIRWARKSLGSFSVSSGGLNQTTRFATVDRKSTRLNSSHVSISYAVFCLKKKRWSNQINPSSILRYTGCNSSDVTRSHRSKLTP